jgi:hypothetical protein
MVEIYIEFCFIPYFYLLWLAINRKTRPLSKSKNGTNVKLVSFNSTWLIDYCLTSSEQYFSYIQDEYIKSISKWGKGCVNQINDFRLPMNRYGEVRRDKQNVLYPLQYTCSISWSTIEFFSERVPTTRDPPCSCVGLSPGSIYVTTNSAVSFFFFLAFYRVFRRWNFVSA